MLVAQQCNTQSEWDEAVNQLEGHPLQLWGWGELKARHNWQVHRVLFIENESVIIGAASILTRRLPWPFRQIAYVPRGPVWRAGKKSVVLDELSSYAKTHLPGVSLTIEPDSEEPITSKGWRRSENTILIPRTLILDLRQTDEELLADMAKKTRQYIRKSAKEGIEIRRVTTRADIQSCLDIYHQTAQRASFALHDDDYYFDLHEQLGSQSLVFAAFSQGEMVSFLWLASSNATAFELYGGMNNVGQQIRANYALKWFAIGETRNLGVVRYDLNGLLNDGVSTFKQGFAHHETLLVGTYDYVLSPFYILWSKVLPFAKKVLRLIKSRG